MARSKRRQPFVSMTKSGSRAGAMHGWKKSIWRRIRVRVRKLISWAKLEIDEDLVFPKQNEIESIWLSPSDGKQMVDDEKYLRK